MARKATVTPSIHIIEPTLESTSIDELPVVVARQAPKLKPAWKRCIRKVFTFLSLVFALTAFGLVCNYFSTKWNQS